MLLAFFFSVLLDILSFFVRLDLSYFTLFSSLPIPTAVISLFPYFLVNPFPFHLTECSRINYADWMILFKSDLNEEKTRRKEFESTTDFVGFL